MPEVAGRQGYRDESVHRGCPPAPQLALLAALGLSVWWGLFLLQVLLAGRTWGVPAAVVLALGAAAVLLSRGGPIRPALLRALEFAIFALIAAALAYFQYRSLWDAITRDVMPPCSTSRSRTP